MKQHLFLATLLVTLWTVLASNRALYLSNKCPYTVRVGATGGNTLLPCASSSDCPQGTTCGLGQCYFSFDEPAAGWDMKPGGSRTVPLNPPVVTSTKQTIEWSGAIFASTGCDDITGCQTAVCPKTGVCNPYAGPLGPRSLVEFTLQPDANDYYDVSIINGVNVPVSMEPVLSPGEKYRNNSNVFPPYYCGAPGTKTPGKGLAPAQWSSFAAPFPENLLVTRSAPAKTCSSDSDCVDGERCGLQMDTDDLGQPSASLSRSCGQPVGYWTADEVCAWTSAAPFGAPFNCNQDTSQGPTYMDLYGCSGGYAHSCYSQGANAQCCGCPDWPSLGVQAPAGQPCQNTNPVWQKVGLPTVSFLKKAVPTAYSFPFDDMSSTFECFVEGPDNANNAASYQITFCPSGETVF